MIDLNSIEAVLAIFVPLIHAHRQKTPEPYVLGLSGLQGSGKSTWAAALSQALATQHNFKTRVMSLDDLYHDHEELVAIRTANPDNGLLQTRGQPGTHDEALAKAFFSQVRGSSPEQARQGTGKVSIKWPAYDKSLHGGLGGRVPVEDWEQVSLDQGLDVLIFEGWCLGFKPLTRDEVTQKWKQARASAGTATEESNDLLSVDTLASHDLGHLLLINENLQRYCEAFTGPQHFDGFLHLSTGKLVHVYEWRLDQERALRRHKPGMTDEQVIKFVRGYMPAYELYLNSLQTEDFFRGSGDGADAKQHVQVVLSRTRDVIHVKELH
ncbi:hypothetical protein FZEAL_3339 [Fusarium zealandicum]|uniref:D-glycerate 3-kinase n=1 Tax=Fusarium zealandicum TaxID=1053134 RepID=A0A8H4UNW6_9HYPO|nr:hypothetical protein FZEAL_3339 [Fusarium zealandicum]